VGSQVKDQQPETVNKWPCAFAGLFLLFGSAFKLINVDL